MADLTEDKASLQVKIVGSDPTGSETNEVGASTIGMLVDVAASVLPTGAATSALQTTGNASLASIDAGIPAALGQTTMAASLPVTIASDQSAIPFTVSDNVILPVNFGALNAAAVVAMAGLQSAGFQINAGTLIGTITSQASVDGGATWLTTDFYDPTTVSAFPSLTFTSANTARTLGVLGLPGASHIRVILTAYTSGTAVASMRATATSSNPISLGGSYNIPLPTLTTGQSTQLQTDANGRLLTSSVSLPTMASKFSFGQVTTAILGQFGILSTGYTEQTTNFAMTLVSSSTSDGSAGTGARTVTVTYLDATGAGPFTTTFTMNGTTAVTSSVSNMCFIEKIQVATIGSTGSNVGILSLKAGATTVATIAATVNQTLWAQHYVPSGKICYISGINIGTTSSTAGGGGVYLLKTATPTIVNSPEVQTSDFIGIPGAAGSITRNYGSPIQIVGPARVRAYVSPNAASSYNNFCSFDYIDN